MAAVISTLNYFSPPADNSRPWTSTSYTYNPNEDESLPASERGRNWTTSIQRLPIYNLRGTPREHTTSINNEGFQYLKHTTNEKDFKDDLEKLKGYYEESVELVKSVTGASRAVVFDHTMRRQMTVPTPNTPSTRQPVPFVHVDQTPEAAVNRVKLHLPADDVPTLLSKRFQIINLWRPIANPASAYPLALCDYTTVNPQTDLVPSTLKYPDREGETFSVKFNEKHKWYYLKDMTPDEAVLIKCYDSIDDGKTASFTPHTSFEDPTTPKDAPPRQSIELRLLVFYD
jgi:hypothetical protein